MLAELRHDLVKHGAPRGGRYSAPRQGIADDQGLAHKLLDRCGVRCEPCLALKAFQIDAFADLTGDRFEIHMDDDAAKALGFPGRVAHGLLVLSLVDGLKNQAHARFRAVASLGWTWRFDGPVFIGDTITATITVVGKRPTRRPDRGIVSLDFVVRNQNGETVQSGQNQLMVVR